MEHKAEPTLTLDFEKTTQTKAAGNNLLHISANTQVYNKETGSVKLCDDQFDQIYVTESGGNRWHSYIQLTWQDSPVYPGGQMQDSISLAMCPLTSDPSCSSGSTAVSIVMFEILKKK